MFRVYGTERLGCMACEWGACCVLVTGWARKMDYRGNSEQMFWNNLISILSITPVTWLLLLLSFSISLIGWCWWWACSSVAVPASSFAAACTLLHSAKSPPSTCPSPGNQSPVQVSRNSQSQPSTEHTTENNRTQQLTSQNVALLWLFF